MNKKNKPLFALFISIVSVSFAAIFINTLINLYNTSPLSIAFYRLFFTTLLILPVILFHKKTRDEITSISSKTMLIMVCIGIILAIHFALWITSLGITSVASSVLLVTAHPVFVGPISHFFFKERLSIVNILGITLSMIGVFVLVVGNYEFSPLSLDSLEGNLLAWLGGIAAGLYILGGRKIRKSVSVISYAFIVYFVGSILLFFICILFRTPLLGFDFHIYGIVMLMALISGIFGHTLYNWSLKHVRAYIASVALLGEPLGSTVLAIIIPWIYQIPSKFTLYGGIFILVGIYLTARKKTKIKKS
jgi:drug/metabolite transporter (DMT)-like permease